MAIIRGALRRPEQSRILRKLNGGRVERHEVLKYENTINCGGQAFELEASHLA